MKAKPRIMLKEEDYREALRLLGFAQFNLRKQKIDATETLLHKAIVALGGNSILNDDPNSPGEGFRRGGYGG